MRTLKESIVRTFEIHECKTCGTEYALTSILEQGKRDSGATFYCPNGHSWVFAKSTHQELKEAQARVAALEDENRQAWDLAEERSKELRRDKRRANAGVCQYCQRSFRSVGLSRHIKTKHPGEASELAHPSPSGRPSDD
jgi:hypothetical protein